MSGEETVEHSRPILSWLKDKLHLSGAVAPELEESLSNDEHRRNHVAAQTLLRFTVQRPVIYSGSPLGFFENTVTQTALSSMEDKVRLSQVPHATLVDQYMAKAIMTRRDGASLVEVSSECRQVVDSLPERRFGHVKSARAIGTHVALMLDHMGEQRLLQDVKQICGHFEVPFRPVNEAAFLAHISVGRAVDAATAVELAEDLNSLIHVPDGDRPRAVGFGMPTVLVGTRNGSSH
jgi:hypothetical protein